MFYIFNKLFIDIIVGMVLKLGKSQLFFILYLYPY